MGVSRQRFPVRAAVIRRCSTTLHTKFQITESPNHLSARSVAMTVASSKPPGSRKSWLRILIPLGVVAGVVIAAGPPVLQAVDQKLRAQEIAEATDPATGVLRIESAPMQCASTCGAKRNEARTICGGYLPEDELRRRNIPAPDSSCDAAMVASYSSCMASCGFTAPNKLRNVPQAEWLPADPPPLGSPDELALRKARP